MHRQSRVADTPLGPDRTKRAEYVKLVFKQLQCGKTRLRQHCRAVGDVFCVAKAHGKQREVWNGSQVSQMAARPPPPGKLANPARFVDLLFEHGQEVHMSKRDVQTCFDNLQALEQLQEWFGRPPVTLHELNRVTGVSTKKLQQYIVKIKGAESVSRCTPLFPTSTVWPMGFSWSSCIAQACTVSCCCKAGV